MANPSQFLLNSSKLCGMQTALWWRLQSAADPWLWPAAAAATVAARCRGRAARAS